MSPRWVAACGSAGSFVLAVIAGVAGNQLGRDALWAWVAFGAALVLGAAVTAFVAHRAAGASRRSAGIRVGDVSADGGQAVGVNYGDLSQTQERREPRV